MQISCDPLRRTGGAGSRRETPAFRRDGEIAAATVLTVFVTKLQMGPSPAPYLLTRLDLRRPET